MALGAIQLMGGNGYINDYSTGRLQRDAKLYQIGGSTSDIRRMLIGRDLANTSAEGANAQQSGRETLKVNIEIEMTPAELRDAMGLPDVKSVQDRWIAKLEEEVEKEIASLSPAAIAERWADALAPSPERLNNLFQMMQGLSGKK